MIPQRSNATRREAPRAPAPVRGIAGGARGKPDRDQATGRRFAQNGRVPNGEPRTMRVLLLVAAAVVALASPPAPAADAGRGRDLYESACIGCHGRSVHARAKTSVHDCTELRAAVARFAGIQGRNWDGEDVDDVVAWLNLRYYGFPVQEGRCVAPIAAQRAIRAAIR